MSAAFKTSLGVLAVLAGAVLSPGNPAAHATVDFLLGAGYVVWRLGLVRSLLVGCVAFCVAAALIPPMCGLGRPRAYVAAMKSDLKNLASQQEIHYADRYAYSTSYEELGFVSSAGVSITVVASDAGWSAAATHAALEIDIGCVIYFGSAPVPVIGGVSPSQQGEVVCSA